MRLAEVTRDVADQLQDVSERYQVPQRLQLARESARRGAQVAYDNAYRSAQHAYRMAMEHPRASAASCASDTSRSPSISPATNRWRR